MDIPFSQLFIVNRAEHIFGPKGIRFAYGAQADNSPTHTEDGQPIAYLDAAGKTDHFLAMGTYLHAWGRVEFAMSVLFEAVTGLRFSVVRLFMNNQTNQGLHRILESLGSGYLEGERLSRFSTLLARFKTHNTNRNHIVHGQWALDVRLLDWNGRPGCKTRAVVWYDNGLAETRRKLREGCEQTRKSYIFDVPRLASLSKALDGLASDLSVFTRSLTGEDPDEPTVRVIDL